MEKIQNNTSKLLEAMEKIMELGKNSGLSAEFYKKAGRLSGSCRQNCR